MRECNTDDYNEMVLLFKEMDSNMRNDKKSLADFIMTMYSSSVFKLGRYALLDEEPKRVIHVIDSEIQLGDVTDPVCSTLVSGSFNEIVNKLKQDFEETLRSEFKAVNEQDQFYRSLFSSEFIKQKEDSELVSVLEGIAYVIDRVLRHYLLPKDNKGYNDLKIGHISVDKGYMIIRYNDFKDYSVVEGIESIKNSKAGVTKSNGGMGELLRYYPNLLESLEIQEKSFDGTNMKELSFYIGALRDYELDTDIFFDVSSIPLIAEKLVGKIYLESMGKELISFKYFMEEIICNIIMHSMPEQDVEYKVTLNRDCTICIQVIQQNV